jgi:hypothetical protein
MALWGFFDLKIEQDKHLNHFAADSQILKTISI